MLETAGKRKEVGRELWRHGFSGAFFWVSICALVIVLLITTNSPGNTPARGGVLLGEEEPVGIEVEGAGVEALAKVDTGATYSSIDYDIARELGIDLDEQELITVESSLGEDTRRLVEARLMIGGRTMDTTVTVSDRDELTHKVLLGNRDLDGFVVDISREQLTAPASASVESPVASLLEFPPPPPLPAGLLAAMPLAAALIIGLRTMVGLRSFGLFAPVLLAMAFVQIGLVAGIAVFAAMLGAGLLIQPLLKIIQVSHAARLGILLTTVVLALLAVNALVDDPSVTAGWAAAFPVVVTAVVVERFWEAWEQEGPLSGLAGAWWTALAASLAAPLLVWERVQELAEANPFALALAGGFLCALIGAYRGLRLSELLRFRAVHRGGRS